MPVMDAALDFMGTSGQKKRIRLKRHSLDMKSIPQSQALFNGEAISGPGEGPTGLSLARGMLPGVGSLSATRGLVAGLVWLALAGGIAVPVLADGLATGTIPDHAGHAGGAGSTCGGHEPTSLAMRIPADLLERPALLAPGSGAEGIAQTIAGDDGTASDFQRQGLAHLHAYRWIEAARSFHEAARRAPESPLPWVGLARVHDALRDGPAARAHLASARRRLSGPKPERSVEGETAGKIADSGRQPTGDAAHLAAIEARLDATTANPKDVAAQHQRLRETLAELAAANPADVELLVLQGQAEEPGPWGKGQAGGEAALVFYRQALALAPDHPGVHHYLAHTLENLGRHAEALSHAARFAALAPRAPHARHMHAHLLPRSGDWAAAIAELEAADALEREWYSRESIAPADDWHRVHNLTLLGLAHLRAGQMDQAESRLREAFETPIPDPLARAWHGTWVEFLMVTGKPKAARAAAEEFAGRDDPLSAVVGSALSAEALLELQGVEAAELQLKIAETALARLHTLSAEEPMRDAIRAVADDHLIFAETRIALRAGRPDARARALEIATALAANPTFDGWGASWLRLKRLESDAELAGQPELAAQLRAMLGAAATVQPGSESVSRSAAHHAP